MTEGKPKINPTPGNPFSALCLLRCFGKTYRARRHSTARDSVYIQNRNFSDTLPFSSECSCTTACCFTTLRDIFTKYFCFLYTPNPSPYCVSGHDTFRRNTAADIKPKMNFRQSNTQPLPDLLH